MSAGFGFTIRSSLWLEQCLPPASPAPREALAMMESVLAAGPELDRVRRDAESRPAARAWDRLPAILAREAAPGREQRRAARERRALRRRRCGETAFAWTGVPVHIG